MTIREYIHKAIREQKAITIKYRKFDGSVSTRRLSNIEFSDEFGDDYIQAFCHLRNEDRTFKISRILEVDGIKNSQSGSYGDSTSRHDSPSYGSSANSSSSYSSNYSSSSPKKSNEGCYIATMAYGDYNHPQVIVLRDFRDHILSKSLLGCWFIRCYYFISPKLVKILNGHEIINRQIRILLDKVVELLKQYCLNKR